MTQNSTGFLPIQSQQGLQLDDEKAFEIGQAQMDDYAFAEPFCHAVIDDFLPTKLIEQTLAHFPHDKKAHDKIYQKGYGGQFKRQVLPADCDEFTRNLFGFFNSSAMLKFLEGITNIQGLLPDPYFAGGGFHEISTGGLLGVHADFRVNEGLQLIRRVNVLIYLNKNWQEAYGGKLELWDKTMQNKVKEVAPLFNRCVIFNTDIDSFHGHPEPLTTPPDITRKSIALYYYTALEVKNEGKSADHTLYVARPNDSAQVKSEVKKMAVKRDKRAKKYSRESKTNVISSFIRQLKSEVKTKISRVFKADK